MNEVMRVGMVGGGQSSMVGEMHRSAIDLCGSTKLVCGCFSRDRSKSLELNKRLGLNESRVYSSIEELIDKELQLPKDERVQLITIATPNYQHYDMAKLALQNGFHVLIEKPVTTSLKTAQDLAKLSQHSHKVCAVNYTFSGFSILHKMKNMLKAGAIGEINKLNVHYYQGWLATADSQDDPHTRQRLDDRQGVTAHAIADIGVHALQLTEFLSSLRVKTVIALLGSSVAERKFFDNADVVLKLDDGVSGILSVNQAALGEGNNFSIEIYGSKGSIKWDFDHPNEVILTLDGQRRCVQGEGNDECPDTKHAQANIYQAIANEVLNKHDTQSTITSYPTIAEGVRGLAFIESCLESNTNFQQWEKVHLETHSKHKNNRYGGRYFKENQACPQQAPLSKLPADEEHIKLNNR